MNILVVEDVKQQRETLVKIIERNFLYCRVYSCDSKKKAMEIAKSKNIDLFLFDIELVDGSGMDLAKDIRLIEKYKLTGMVFITSNIIQIMGAFKEVHCYDFLIKPYNEEEVKNIIGVFSKNANYIEKEGEYIVVTVEGCVTTKVYYEDIIHIEYSNRKCNVKTKNSLICVKGYGLKELLSEIKSKDIMQCHKAFAINTKYIEKIVKVETKVWGIHFWNCEECVPLGYKYKDTILEMMK